MTIASQRTVRTLNDIRAFSATAERLVARGRAAYDSDETLRLAAEALVHKIGEVVRRLPDDFIDAHPEVPWRAMKGARNLVAHEYGQVDYSIIWNALSRRLPQSAELIRRILDAI